MGFKKSEVKINRKAKKQTNKDVKYYMKFIDGLIFMSTSLSNLTHYIFNKLYGKR